MSDASAQSIINGVTVAAFACILVWFLGGVFGADKPRASDEQVYDASVDAGFTRKAAIFLRHGPMSSVSLCVENDIAESACSFFAASIAGWRHSDAEYYSSCEASGLSHRQCLLLREGVKGYREAFAAR